MLKRFKLKFLVIIILSIILFCSSVIYVSNNKVSAAKRNIEQKLKGDYHPARIMVKFKKGVADEEILNKSKKYTSKEQNFYKPKMGGQIVQSVYLNGEVNIDKNVLDDEEKMEEMRLEYKDELEDLMLKYEFDPDVESVDVVHMGRVMYSDAGDGTYSDDFDSTPDYSEGKHWYYDKINLPEVWDDQECATGGELCGGDSDVIVAVLDTGVAYETYSTGTYEWGGYNYDIDYDVADELNGINLYTNSSDPYGSGDQDGNGICDDYNGVDMEMWVENNTTGDTWDCSSSDDTKKEGHANDDYGHGTYVTGIISSLTDNSANSIGIANNVSIMPIKLNIPFTGFVYEDSFYYSVMYAVDNGADVINASLGWEDDSTGYLKAAVDYAEAAGVTMVISSGNSFYGYSTPMCYPAQYDDSNVIAVGAVNSDNSRSSYSQYGSNLDIVAPVGEGTAGDGNHDATWQQTLGCAWSCSSSSDFTTFQMDYGSGTSFAAPQVAAGAALVKSRSSDLDALEIRNTIVGTATDIGSGGRDDYTGYGILDLEELWNNIWSSWEYTGGTTDRDVNMMVYNPGSGDRLYQAVKGMSSRIYTR